PPNVVFTSMVAGFELAEADSRYVAVNLVQPEDGPISSGDYHLHMQMLDYLRGVYHRSHITLHAGELTPALSPPPHLPFHTPPPGRSTSGGRCCSGRPSGSGRVWTCWARTTTSSCCTSWPPGTSWWRARWSVTRRSWR